MFYAYLQALLVLKHQALGSSGSLCSLQLPEPLCHCRHHVALPYTEASAYSKLQKG